MEFIDDKLRKNFIMTLIVIVVLFLIGISIYIVKSSSLDSYCGVELNTAIDKIDYKTTGSVITSSSTVLESISLNSDKYSYFFDNDFCVNGEVNADNALEFIVYDKDHVVLGNSYFSNGSGYHCVNVDKDFDLKDNFVGFKCSNCDTNGNNFTPVISVGTDVLLITNGVFSFGDQLDYAIKSYVSCEYMIFRLFKYMMLTIVLFGLIFLLMLGVSYIKKVAFSGW